MACVAAFVEFDLFKLSGIKVTDHVLGSGSYATVLELKYKGQKCAGKKIHDLLLAQEMNTYALRRFEEECRLLSQVHHPNIVQFLGLFFQKNCPIPILVMEFLPTNLTSCIEQHGILCEEVSYPILHNVASGLHYLHSHDPVIIHRDLSSNNILLTSDLTVAKISDLGVARILNKTPQQMSQMTGTPGTPAYMPPEVMAVSPRYDTSVDIFSYGILIVHVLCGQLPVPQVGQIRMEANRMIPVSEAERRAPFLSVINEQNPLMDLIQRCINNNPQLRPPTEEIIAHLKQLVPGIPKKHLTLQMPAEVMVNKRRMDVRKVQSYEIVTSEAISRVNNPKKLIVKGTSQMKVSDSEKQCPSREDKVRIPTSWAEKRFKKAVGFLTRKDQSKVTAIDKDKHEYEASLPCNPLYVAKLDYESCTCNDMSLRRGEKLCVTNTDDDNWWFAISPGTGKEGYVPTNYIAKLTNPVYTVLHEYQSQDSSELSVVKGEKLFIVHSGDGHRWFARSKDTQKEGYISCNYLAEPTFPFFAAIYDYVSCTETDLSFKQSDQLCVIDTEDKDWWFARSMESGKEGFVPSNYLTEVIYPIYAAVFDYQSRTDDDLSFEKTNLLCILNADDKDWWLARSKNSGEEGYVPSNYVAKVNSLNIHKWYFGDVSRMEAERQLLEEGNQCGSFLVRQSETIIDGYALSVREKARVRHYKIQYEVKGAFKYFITERMLFKTIPGLIAHYQSQSGGLCVRLVHPCISSQKPQTPGLSKHTNDNWDIDRSQLTLVKEIQGGTFSQVFDGLWNGTLPVVVKAIKSNIVSRSVFLQEAALMRRLRHSKVVQVYAVSTDKEPLYIVTEKMKYGSLFEYLHTSQGMSLALPRLINIASQVSAGMAYLEERDYHHGGLCARNVLVGDFLVCKVAGFGLARIVNSCHNGTDFRIKWAAPEAALCNKFTIKSDVWSFGILLFEIVTYGNTPYPNLSDEEVLEKLKQGYRMPQPKECSYMYYNIMLKCWREEPENRPTFEALQWELEEFLDTMR